MAALIIMTYLLRRAGYLEGVVSTQHFHIMGKLLLSFTVFWAYIAFSQFFLIWYANIPEETEFFVVRNTEGWNLWAILLEVGCHFFVTFALLCPRAAKTNPKRLAYIAVWVLLSARGGLVFHRQPVPARERRPAGDDDRGPRRAGDHRLPAGAAVPAHAGTAPALARRDARLPESLRLVN